MSESQSDLRSYFEDRLGPRLEKIISAAEETFSFQLLRTKNKSTEELYSMMKQRKELESILPEVQEHRAELQKKKQQLKNDHRKFDNILKNNEVERCRVMRNVIQLRELNNQKQAKLLALQEELTSLTKKRDGLMRRVEKNVIYPEYLDKVVLASGQFQKKSQLMACCESLKRNNLLWTTQQIQDNIKTSKAHLACITEDDNKKLLLLGNKLSLLRSKLCSAQTERMIWESRWVYIQNTATEKTRLLGTIKMAIINLFQMARKERRHIGDAQIDLEDAFMQLNMIKMFLLDLLSIQRGLEI